MTTLYLDLGNTKAKWQLSGSGGGAFAYDDLRLQIDQIIRDHGAVQNVIIATVLDPQSTHHVVSELRHKGLNDIKQCVVTEFAAGVSCGYDDIARLGVDRWLAVLAAWHRYGRACLVVDLGTAATLDVVDSAGHHLGGFIVGGLSLAVSGLLDGTRNIRPKTHGFDGAGTGVGRSTAAAVYNGALASLVALVDKQFEKLLKSDSEAKLVLAGGDASIVGSHLQSNYELVHGLVFDGMKVLEQAQLLVEVE